MKPCIVEEVQQLLFDRSPFVVPGASGIVPESFYTKGWGVVDGFASIAAARTALDALIGGLDTGRLPLFAGMIERMQLAKQDAIPVCEDIVQTGFQALHYDMGMPFLAEQPQALYTISALYRPMESEPNPLAKTRIVSIPTLLSQAHVADRKTLETRLRAYIRTHGDGWTTPTAHNTHRLAIFARVIDALTGQNKLADKIDTMIGQCFDYDHGKGGEYGLQQEHNFFKDAGFDLSLVEEQIILKPGEMLVFDNMRCVHGRIGQRRKRELINFLYGVKEAKADEIDRYKTWLYGLLADKK